MPRQNITINEDTSWERMWASETSGLLRILKPWAALAVLLGFGELYHVTLGHPPVVTWACVGMTLAGTGVSAYAWITSRLMPIGRAHSSATVAAAMLWLVMAVITGPVSNPTGYLLLVFGPATAVTWNLRGHARAKMAAGGEAGTPAGRLSEWFADAAKEAGVAGTSLQVKSIEPYRATATAIMPPGEQTATTLQNKVKHIESGGKVPPGALAIAEDPDRADHAIVTLSDPRLIRRPIPHPGPSAPGESIAKPLRTGIWQDGVPVAHSITGHHVHVMGSSGAGKSEGGCWCYGAEIISRSDAAIMANDITKATQTFGPLEPALHRVEYTKDGWRDFANTLHRLLPQRTAQLGDLGLTKWVPGCGLTYWIPWMEEAPDLYEALTSKEQDNWISDIRALRSGGGSWFVSLQRNTFDQLPTIVRGQMAHLCFGLQDSGDAKYGLSTQQQDMGADPAAIGLDHPGTAYLHYPGTPPERIAMRMRHYAWGDVSSKEAHDATAAAAMAAYAAQFPASARPVDELTAQLIGGQPGGAGRHRADAIPARAVAVLTRPAHRDQDGEPDTEEDSEMDENVRDEYLTTDDPTPDLEAGPDDPIEDNPDDEPFEFDLADPPDPATARAAFTEHLRKLREDGKTELATRDFQPIMRRGMSRTWVQARLKEAVERGDLEHDPDNRTYTFTDPVPAGR
jgi:hypothetical protein